MMWMNKEQKNTREKMVQTMLIMATILVSFRSNDSSIFILFLISTIFYYCFLIFDFYKLSGPFNLLALMSAVTFSAVFSVLIGVSVGGKIGVLYSFIYYLLIAGSFTLLLITPKASNKVIKEIGKIKKHIPKHST